MMMKMTNITMYQQGGCLVERKATIPVPQLPSAYPNCHPLTPTATRFRLLMKILDYNFMAFMAALFSKHLPDFKRQQAAEAAAAKQK